MLQLRELLLSDEEIRAFSKSAENTLHLSYHELRRMALDARFFAALTTLKAMNISPMELLPRRYPSSHQGTPDA